jgi:hypothetical protein
MAMMKRPVARRRPIAPSTRSVKKVCAKSHNPGANSRLDQRGDAGEEGHPFIAIASKGEPVAPRSEPPRLLPNPLWSAEIVLEFVKSRDFVVSGGDTPAFSVNGVIFADWAPKFAYIISRGHLRAR